MYNFSKGDIVNILVSGNGMAVVVDIANEYNGVQGYMVYLFEEDRTFQWFDYPGEMVLAHLNVIPDKERIQANKRFNLHLPLKDDPALF